MKSDELLPVPNSEDLLGGMRLYFGFPMCRTYLLSYAADGKWVLVSDPKERGSCLKTDAHGTYLFTGEEIIKMMNHWKGSGVTPC